MYEGGLQINEGDAKHQYARASLQMNEVGSYTNREHEVNMHNNLKPGNPWSAAGWSKLYRILDVRVKTRELCLSPQHCRTESNDIRIQKVATNKGIGKYVSADRKSEDTKHIP